MQPEVRLANDIAAQFRHRPADEAAAEVAKHIRLFWDPRMRSALESYVDAGEAELDPIAVDAVGLIRTPS